MKLSLTRYLLSITKHLKSINKILFKTLVIPFYREIGGMLLFLFFVLFGIQQSMRDALRFHYELIIEILENNIGLLIFFLVMTAYTGKCILFIKTHTTKKTYQFLRILGSVKIKHRCYHATILSLAMLAPVIIYSFTVIVIAIKLGEHIKYFQILLFLILLIGSLSFSFIYFLKKENGVLANKKLFKTLLKLPKSIAWFLWNHIFTDQLRAIVPVKLLSFIALFYFIKHDDSVFEERMLWLIFLLCIVAHGVIIYKNFYFLENEFSFYRNIPLSNLRVFGNLLLVYVLLCLPEFWALRGLGFLHHNWYTYLCMITSGPFILLLLHCLLYSDDMTMENYLPLLFGVCMVLFFFSFSENKWLVPAVAFSGSVVIFYTSFRKYERRSEVERLD